MAMMGGDAGGLSALWALVSDDFTSLNKLKPQTGTSRIQPGTDVIVCAEMNQLWGYVRAKSRQRWLFYAYDSLRNLMLRTYSVNALWRRWGVL